MPRDDHSRAIAMAGLYQTAAQVRAIARRGQADPADFETCLESLFKIDAASSEDVYGGTGNLRSGLRLLAEQLRNPDDMELTRYVVALLVLERKLSRRPRLLEAIRRGIEAAGSQRQYFPLTHDNVVAKLADIYSSTVSTLKPRIMVNGEHAHLTRPENANRIRALLLAGIRAAVLWRQSGGGRITLLLRRRQLLSEVQRLLAAADD